MPLTRLPLVTLYLSDRCNSRCVSCDYWRHGRDDMSIDYVKRLLPSLTKLKTEMILLSGGEPLLNPEWESIARLLRASGFKLWLVSSGLSLAKHADRAARSLDAITVSLDGADAATYAKIRGVNAFDRVCEGIRAVAARGLRPGVRVTLQSSNYRQLPALVALAKELGAQSISFLAVDVANPIAFGRGSDFTRNLGLDRSDLSILDQVLSVLENDCRADFESGFIVETPSKLRQLARYFAAVQGLGPYPETRCNVAEFSAVIGPTGRVQPCFFISDPDAPSPEMDLSSALNTPAMTGIRSAIRSGARAECKTCVCSLWRDGMNA